MKNSAMEDNAKNGSRSTVKRRASGENSPPNFEKQSAVTTRIISGSVGSLVTSLAVTPLEVVKVHLQNARPEKTTTTTTKLPPGVSLCPKGCGTFVLNNGLFDCVLPKSAVPYFDKRGNFVMPAEMNTAAAQSAQKSSTTRTRGTIEIVRHIFLKEGFRGIYAGLAPTLVMGIPSTALYYSVYDEIVTRMQKATPDKANVWVPLFAGSSARLLSTMVTSPLELIRTRQASMAGQGEVVTGMVADFKAIVKQDGFGALYRGLGPTLWRDVPFSGIYWLCLENFRGFWQRYYLSEVPPTAMQEASISFLSGASAGMVAAACTTPFDVVKTRQQAVLEEVVEDAALASCDHHGHVVYESKSVSRSPSVFGSMKTIYEQEGLNGLWRGNQTRMIKVAPSCAIMITCYELGKRALASD